MQSKHNDPVTTVETITPEMAQQMLDTSIGNRKESPGWVITLEAAMREGRWGLSSDCIQIDVNGCLRNGHHRLWALVRSGKTLRFNVMRGCPLDMFYHTDTGRKRKVSDYVEFEGWTNNVILSTTLAKWWAYIKTSRNVTSQTLGGRFPKGRSENNAGTFQSFTVDDALFILEKWGAYLLQSVRLIEGMSQRMKVLSISRGDAVFAHACWAEHDRVVADGFWKTVCSGQSTREGDPAIALRNVLIEDKQNKIARGKSYSRWAIWKMTMRAMNAYYMGDSLQSVKKAANADHVYQPHP